MKKYACVFAALVALTFTGITHAEFRFGMESRSVEANAGGDIIHAGKSDRSNAVLPFVQYRHTFAGGMQVGGHLGFGTDTADFQSEQPFSETLDATFQYNDGSEIPVTVTFDRRVTRSRAGRTFDLTALLAFPGARITPIAMFGWTSAKIETTVTQAGKFTIPEGERTHSRLESKENKTFTGWKVSSGVEFHFDEFWAGYALFDYAEVDNGSVNFEQTGFRFGIAYRF